MQNLQPMELVTDSTRSAESRVMTTYPQSEVGKYAKRIAGLIIDDPHVSAPGILQQLKPGGGHAARNKAWFTCSGDVQSSWWIGHLFRCSDGHW